MLEEIIMLDRKFFIRTEATDQDGSNWDRKILEEVIRGDFYQLQDLKSKSPDIKTFVDIGANIGAFPVFVKHLWPEAHVVCAEPLTNNFELLQKNTEGLSGVEIVNKAIIGTDEPEVGFNAPTLITKTREAYFNSGDGYVNRNVQTKVFSCKFQELVKDLDNIDFLKFDCEGSEGEILESIVGTPEMKKIKYICGEWHGLKMDTRIENALRSTHVYKTTKFIFTDLGIFEALRIEK